MMLASQRRAQIVAMLKEDGYLNANQLAEKFEVDGSTIRRDLIQLEKKQQIVRTHGGVLPAQSSVGQDTPYAVRQNLHHAEKAAIARYAADLVQDGQSLILDNGSTVYELALALKDKKNLTVITNDLHTAMVLSHYPNLTLHVAGGLVLGNVYTMVGPETTQKFNSLHVDWAFLGAEGVHYQNGITNINTVEITTKLAMLNAAERKVVLADSSKIGYRALSHVCPLSDVDRVITDNRQPVKNAARYGQVLTVVER